MICYESLFNCSIAMEDNKTQSILVSFLIPGILIAVTRSDMFAPLLSSSFTHTTREGHCSAPQ